MTTVAVAAPARTRLGRLVAALPIVTVFVWLYLVYAWESWGHVTPWLFTDELETTQLARSIAETGEASRRGTPHSFDTLFTFLLAPAWWIDDAETAYTTAKYIGITVMTSAVFPAYWLARMLVSQRPALFAAAATGAIPAFLYAAMFVEEPLAYPVSTFVLFLIVKALATQGRWWLGAAAVACAGALLVRDELAVLTATYALSAAALLWLRPRLPSWRATWTKGDWIGAATLLVGATVVVNAFVAHNYYGWLVSTTFYKGRMIEYGLWAAGALTIGLGVLPVVAGLAALWRRAERTPAERAFVVVTAFAIVGFGWYTAVKAAYISTVFSTLVVERNLIYVAPLLFVATALFLERGGLRPVPVVAAGAFALLLVLSTPYKLEFYPYSDAPGLTILQAANRELGMTPSEVKWALVGIVVASVVVCLLPLGRRGPSLLPRIGAVSVAGLVVAWNLTGQIAAAHASNQFAAGLLSNFPRPLDWVDRATGGAKTLFLGQRITDPNGVWLLEFWNRSIRGMWSVDGTAPGPGPVLTPDVIGSGGELTPAPGFEYVVVDEGIDIVGTVRARVGHGSAGVTKYWQLIEIEPPLRLAQARTGIYDDGWAGRDSAYSRFATPGNRPGFAIVSVSRAAFAGAPEATVRVRVGELVLDDQRQPAMGRVTTVVTWKLSGQDQRRFVIPTPRPPFRADVRITPTFIPAEIDPAGSSELRELGAQVGFDFSPTRPKP